jgi:hypothetical protein
MRISLGDLQHRGRDSKSLVTKLESCLILVEMPVLRKGAAVLGVAAAENEKHFEKPSS